MTSALPVAAIPLTAFPVGIVLGKRYAPPPAAASSKRPTLICSFSDYSTQWKSNLNAHIITDHRHLSNAVRCLKCYRDFPNVTKLKLHLKTEAPIKPCRNNTIVYYAAESRSNGRFALWKTF